MAYSEESDKSWQTLSVASLAGKSWFCSDVHPSMCSWKGVNHSGFKETMVILFYSLLTCDPILVFGVEGGSGKGFPAITIKRGSLEDGSFIIWTFCVYIRCAELGQPSSKQENRAFKPSYYAEHNLLKDGKSLGPEWYLWDWRIILELYIY